MHETERHRWVRERLGAWQAGLLTDEEATRVADHLGGCEECRAASGSFEAAGEAGSGAHLPPSLVAEWPRARARLRGLERALVSRHLERCAECRQDLEMLGHEPRLERVPEWESRSPQESEEASTAAVEASPPRPGRAAADRGAGPVTRIVRVLQLDPRRRWRERVLGTWAAVATAAAAVALVMLVRRPVVEGVPMTLWATLPPPAAPAAAGRAEGISVRLAPRPRSLSRPARGPGEGRATIIPVAGPVGSLALSIRPLEVPDTSMVTISLLGGGGDTLLTVRHRQWEFFPKRVLVIDGGRTPLEPGRYVLELASHLAGEEAVSHPMIRYAFELRPRTR